MLHSPLKSDRVSPQRLHDAGKTYVIVPVTMLTVGVHSGSNGPVYYPAYELSRSPHAWDRLPVTVDHPSRAGRPISAAERDAKRHHCGQIDGATFNNGILSAELWIDEQLLHRLAPSLLRAVNNGENVEVSTGLFFAFEKWPGVFNGKEYNATARDITPDHLALLTDAPGACSVADGCGTFQTNDAALIRGPEMNTQPNPSEKTKNCSCRSADNPPDSFPSWGPLAGLSTCTCPRETWETEITPAEYMKTYRELVAYFEASRN